MAIPRFSVLLGGVGGDCHSVGLTILRHALLANGYNVECLGIQNTVRDFFLICQAFNVVMISSMDGHSRYYLAEFPGRLKTLGNGPLWYLGGNLAIDNGTRVVRKFLEMGFSRVFPTFVDIDAILEFLKRDLHEREPRPGLTVPAEPGGQLVSVPDDLSDAKVSRDDFVRRRRQVLHQWKTGAAARDLEQNAVFLCRQPSFARMQALANRARVPLLLQPRSGVPSLEEQIRFFRVLSSCGARVLSYQVDSLTRVSDYRGAEEAIRDSASARETRLNGFPVVNHGVPGLRKVISTVPVPLQTRHSARDPALLAEISYAGGVTAFEGGAICYNIPYYRDYPLDQSIARWQYVDRLTGHYFSRFGIVLDREFFGTLTGTLIPPCLAIATDLLESILAVQQGVKCLSLGYAEQGNRNQDIAAVRTLRAMALELLAAMGYTDIQVNTVFHQYMAAFPNNRSRAEQLVYESGVTAALSGATRVMVKTPAEAFNIPSLEDNVGALKLVRGGTLSADPGSIDEAAVAVECEVIRRETTAIVDSVIMSGGGVVAKGIVTAFRRGYLDIPFSPNIHNKGAVITARDVTGAVRFLSTGALPFDSELRDFHRSKLDERRRAEGIASAAQSYRLVEQDVMQIARGRYAAWPLSADPARHTTCAFGTAGV